MRFDFEEPPAVDAGEDEEAAIVTRNDVKARFSLQTATLLQAMGVKEHDVYEDADS